MAELLWLRRWKPVLIKGHPRIHVQVSTQNNFTLDVFEECLNMIDEVVVLQVVMIENRGLRAEVRRLHMENSHLLHRVRFSDSNAHYMRNQVHWNRDFVDLWVQFSFCRWYLMWQIGLSCCSG